MYSFLHLSAGFCTVPGNAVFALFRSPSVFCSCFYVNSLVISFPLPASINTKKRSGGSFRSSGCVEVLRGVFDTVCQGRNMTRGGANLCKLLKINSALLETVFVVAEMCVEKYDRLPVICSAALFCSPLIVYPVVS